MKTHTLIQGSPEWHAHRRNHFNASDAPAMMGCSPYKTRTQLLHELATGITPEVDAATQRRFDDGHRYEALARPIAEQIIGEDLYPVTGSAGLESASFDGLTMTEETGYEHKSLNAELREVMVEGCTGADLPLQYQVQMEQQCLVSGAARVLFMASKWNGDALVEERHCWYYPNPELRQKILAGWAQFAADLAAYKPEAATVEAVAATIEALPALTVEVSGRVVASNLVAFKQAASTFLANIKTELDTDQDFADAEQTIKFCTEGEDRLDLVKEQALAQTASIDELFRTIDGIKGEMRQTRLALERSVKARKESIRVEICTKAQAELDAHVIALNTRLGANWVPRESGSFGLAIKGKRTVASCKDAAATALAAAKIDASALADRLDANRKSLVGEGHDWFFLFADFPTVGGQPEDIFAAIASSRIHLHKAEQAECARAEEVRKAAAAAAVPVLQPRIAKSEPAASPELTRALTSIAALAGPEVGTLNAGAMANRLGFTMTTDFIEQTLGVEHCGKDTRKVKLWSERQFRMICSALAKHVATVAQGEAQPA